MKYFYDTEFLEGRQRRRFCAITIGYTAPTIDLISIGIVAEDGREYYAISNEFNLWEAWNRFDKKVNRLERSGAIYYDKVYWIRDNVLKPIFNELADKYEAEALNHNDWPEPMFFCYDNMHYLLQMYGKSRETIAKEVAEFIVPSVSTINSKPAAVYDHTVVNIKDPIYQNVELWAYYGAYDHVALMWLWGKMLDKPQYLPMFSWDLKLEVDKKVLQINSLATSKQIHSESHQVKGFEFPWLLPDTESNILSVLKSHKDYPKQDPEKEHNALEDARWNKQLYCFLESLKD